MPEPVLKDEQHLLEWGALAEIYQAKMTDDKHDIYAVRYHACLRLLGEEEYL